MALSNHVVSLFIPLCSFEERGSSVVLHCGIVCCVVLHCVEVCLTLFSWGVKRTMKVEAMPGATLLHTSTGLTTLKYSESSSTTFTRRGIWTPTHKHAKFQLPRCFSVPGITDINVMKKENNQNVYYKWDGCKSSIHRLGINFNPFKPQPRSKYD